MSGGTKWEREGASIARGIENGVATANKDATGHWFEDGVWDVDRVHALLARGTPRLVFAQRCTQGSHFDWKLRPPASISDIERYEHKSQLTLPSDYRAWLLDVSDGFDFISGIVYPLIADPKVMAQRGRVHGTSWQMLSRRWPLVETTDRDSLALEPPPRVLAIGENLDLPQLRYFMVARGSCAGEMWRSSYSCRDGWTRLGQAFHVWLGQWLDDVSAHEFLTVQVGKLAADPALVRVGQLVHGGEGPDAVAELEGMLSRDDAVAACALRAIGSIDPNAALALAPTYLDSRVPEVVDAAFDVVTWLGKTTQLPLLESLRRQHPDLTTQRGRQLMTALLNAGFDDAEDPRRCRPRF